MITKEQLLAEMRRRGQLKNTMISGLFGKQQQFVADPSQFKMARCSRRAGKSYACARYLLHIASTTPDANCCYLALTRKSAKRILWGILKKLSTAHSIKISPKEAELTIELANGSSIVLLGANDETVSETLRGSPWDLVVIDEVASYRGHLETLVDEIITPALVDRNGKIALIGTPSSDFTSFFKKCEDSKAWSVHHWTMFDNPHITGASTFLDTLLQKKGWTPETPLVQREWYGQWARSSLDQVYNYSPLKNRVDEAPTNLLYVIGVDVGWTDDKAIVVIGFNPDISRKTYVVHKFKKSNMLISDLGEMLQKLDKQYNPITTVIDPGGGGADISAEINNRFGLSTTMAKKTSKADYIEFLNAELEAGFFMNVVEDEHDPLEKEYAELQWADKDKRKEGGQANHLSDACLYAWREAYAYLHETPAAKPTPEQAITNMSKQMEADIIRQMEEKRAIEQDWEQWL